MFDLYSSQLFDSLSRLNLYRKGGFTPIASYVREIVLPNIQEQATNETEIYLSVNERMSRSLFFLLKFLTTGGKTVTHLNNISYLNYIDEYAKKSLQLDHVTFSKRLPDVSENKILIYDQPKPKLMERKWKKLIKLDFDISSPRTEHENCIFMPFTLHPYVYITNQHEQLPRFRANSRKIKIFFAGNIDPKSYETQKINYLREKFNKMLRSEIIQTLISELGDEAVIVTEQEQMRLVDAGKYFNKCVIVDRHKFSIREPWLEILSKSDFFVCPPGVIMPNSHNSIEAMAVGTIPLINYPEWFHPRLEHMKNCIEFSDEKGLVKQVKYIFGMKQTQIEEMRNNAIEYYEKYLSPQSFQQKILDDSTDSTTLFINIGRLRYLRKIRWDSVIISQSS